MGTSWAVGAATTLALVAVLGFSGSPHFVVVAFLATGLAMWAYAIAMGAYGSKGALVALLANVLVAATMGALTLRRAGAAADAPLRGYAGALLVVMALLAAWAILGELRARRGKLQWTTAALFAAPMVLALAASLYVTSVNAGS